MDRNQEPRREPIRVTPGTQLMLFALGWALIALPGIVLGMYTPNGLASIFGVTAFALAITSFLWVPLVLLGFCVGRRQITPVAAVLFVACQFLAFAISVAMFLVLAQHSWLD